MKKLSLKRLGIVGLVIALFSLRNLSALRPGGIRKSTPATISVQEVQEAARRAEEAKQEAERKAKEAAQLARKSLLQKFEQIESVVRRGIASFDKYKEDLKYKIATTLPSRITQADIETFSAIKREIDSIDDPSVALTKNVAKTRSDELNKYIKEYQEHIAPAVMPTPVSPIPTKPYVPSVTPVTPAEPTPAAVSTSSSSEEAAEKLAKEKRAAEERAAEIAKGKETAKVPSVTAAPPTPAAKPAVPPAGKEPARIELETTRTLQDQFAKRGMAIFLDDSEFKHKPGKAITSALICALYQQAYPILASTALFESIRTMPNLTSLAQESKEHRYAVVNTYFDNMQKKMIEISNVPTALDKSEIERLLSEYRDKELKIETNKLLYDERTGPALLKNLFQLAWNPKDWIIKIAADGLLLLIPRSYLELLTKFHLLAAPVKLVTEIAPKNSPFTEAEYALGLKIDHMQTINDYTDALSKPIELREQADYFIKAITNNDIFVPRIAYTQAKKHDLQPRWALYMIGHGNLGFRVCYMSFTDFSAWLDFLEKKIDTSFFVYNSCFGLGTNEKAIFGDIHKTTAKQYSFIIATQGIPDDVTAGNYTISWFSVDLKHKTFTKLKSRPDLNSFFRKLHEGDMDFEPVIQNLFDISGISRPLTTPHIRLPGREWFKIGEDPRTATISKIFAQTQSGPVDLVKKFTEKGKGKKPPLSYFIFTPVIPFELILTEGRPTFIPMAPYAMHSILIKTTEVRQFQPIFNSLYIKKITAPKLSLNDIVDMFTSAVSKYYGLAVWLDEVEYNDGKKPTKITDVLIQKFENSTDIDLFYKYQDDVYRVLGPIDNRVTQKMDKGSWQIEYLDIRKKEFDKLREEFEEKRKPMQELEAILKKRQEPKGQIIPKK